MKTQAMAFSSIQYGIYSIIFGDALGDRVSESCHETRSIQSERLNQILDKNHIHHKQPNFNNGSVSSIAFAMDQSQTANTEVPFQLVKEPG